MSMQCWTSISRETQGVGMEKRSFRNCVVRKETRYIILHCYQPALYYYSKLLWGICALGLVMCQNRYIFGQEIIPEPVNNITFGPRRPRIGKPTFIASIAQDSCVKPCFFPANNAFNRLHKLQASIGVERLLHANSPCLAGWNEYKIGRFRQSSWSHWQCSAS